MHRENVEVTKFLRAIRAMPGAYAIKVHGDQFCEGEPDTVGVYCGLPFSFEWKRGPREQLSALQKAKLKRWEQAGSYTAVQIWAQAALDDLAYYAASKLGVDKAAPISVS